MCVREHIYKGRPIITLTQDLDFHSAFRPGSSPSSFDKVTSRELRQVEDFRPASFSWSDPQVPCGMGRLT